MFTPERIAQETAALNKWIENPNNYYTLGFLNERDLDPKQAERMCEYDETFRHAYAKAKRIQEQRLVNLAVTKKGDGNFIKFVLASKMGWKDETTVNHNLNPLASLLDKIGLEAQDPIVIEHVDSIEP